MNTGEKIKQAREKQDMSKAELHRKSGVAYSTIVDIERGNRSGNFETISVLAEALGVSLDSLRADKD